MASANPLNRSDTEPDLEIGVSEVLRHHVTRHLRAKPVSRKTLAFEHKRPTAIRECLAEAIGVFFYVFAGVSSVASLITNALNPLGPALFSNYFQIGMAYGLGITFAIIVAAPTSGGHFNPCITICFAVWQGFPWKKVPRYIISQIIGSMIAAFLVAGMYWQQISEYKELLEQAKQPLVSSTGPAGIFASYPGPKQNNHGYLFLIEFFVDSFLAFIIWAAIDPANPFVSPQTIPFVIGLGYAIIIWGFAPITISANMAKDLGCRIVAAAFFGGEAFTFRHYAWISILVSIPASLFGTAVYELVMRDSLAKIVSGQAEFQHGREGLASYLSESGFVERVKTKILQRQKQGQRVEVFEDSATGKLG